jgi:hypothetical protein
MQPGDLVQFWSAIHGREHGLILELVPHMQNRLEVLVLRADGRQVFKSPDDLEVVREERSAHAGR